jgi:PAS domain S-box-containing protein
MNEKSQLKDGPQVAPVEATGLACRMERYLTLLACSSDSNLRILKRLLRLGLAFVFCAELASWLETTLFEPALVVPLRPFLIFDLALAAAFVGFTYLPCFEGKWRAVAMTFCLSLVASSTWASLAVGQDEPLVLMLFVLVLCTAVLVPWSVRCQAILSLAGLVSFALTVTDGVIEPMDVSRWLVLSAVATFALTFAALKDQHRAQVNLIDKMRDKEKRLSRSQKVLRTLFDAVPDIVTLTRFSDGKLFEVNDEFLNRTGLTREQALSTSVTRTDAWVRPEERDRYIEQLKASGRVRNLEADFRLNGTIAPYLMSSVSVEIDGEIYALNVARDATEIKEHEYALRQAQERLRAQVEELTATQAQLRAEVAERESAERVAREHEAMVRKTFEASPDVITVSSRRDMRLIHANSTFFRVTGYAPEEVLSRQVYARFWANPAQRERLNEALDRDGFAHNVEADLAMKDGTINSYLLSAVAIDVNGEPCRVSFWRDVTEAKRAAQRIADSETMLRRVFDAIPDIVFTRRGNVVTDVNEEFVERSGLTRAEVLGRPVREVTLFNSLADRAEFLRRVRAEGIVRNFQADFKIKGQAVPYLISGGSIETEDGPIIFSISRDISSRIQMEQELIATREAALAASQAKSEFLSSMSHEIRTPMNAILGMADLLSDGDLNPEERRYVDTMRSNGNALLRLINDILDIAKIESGRLSLESVGFNLEEMVGKAVETMGLRAHGKGLELTARILPHVPLNLIGDPLRLRQILINLTANAIKFTESGEVSLAVESLSPAEALRLGFVSDTAADAHGEASAPTAWLRFSVADTGVGIAADKLETIFSGFTQADASISRRFGGTGLGLTIVRRLSKMMSGRVEVESEVGRGSVFRVTVGLGVDTRPAACPEQGAAANFSLAGVRILVVDDNATNRLILSEMLVRQRARVTEAASGAEALAELARARAAGDSYRLMLLDYRMPEMDGVEVARKAIDDGLAGTTLSARDTVIMMLTSDDLNFRLARMRELGLQSYLIKPIKRAELLDQIRRLLSGPDAAPALRKRSESAAVDDGTPPLRILLAEDAPDNRFLIQAYLKKLPYRIDIAENGRVAIEKFKAARPDLVLMDVQMPEIDGLTATRVIRQWEGEQGLARTPIVALTASALEDDIQRSLAAGCDQHVSKPVRKPVLLAAIRKAIDSRATAGGAAATSAPGAQPLGESDSVGMQTA